MSESPVTTNADVYTTDFYTWCLTTAALVRAGQWDDIDPEALAEELESLGKSQKRELESRLEVLVMHLLKWEYQPQGHQDSHSWYDTIVEQRSQIARLLRDNPRLRPQVPEILRDVYPDSCRRATGHMGHLVQRGGLGRSLPRICPWPAEQVLDKDFWPA